MLQVAVATSVLDGMEATIFKEDREEELRTKGRIRAMDNQLLVDMVSSQPQDMEDTSSKTTKCSRSNMMLRIGMQTPTTRISHNNSKTTTSNSPNNSISKEPRQVRTTWVKLADILP
jgi:hypothetical protein